MAYESLAASYDRLTNDIPYEEILHFYDQILARYDAHPETALDLACGTGSMAVLLAGRGLSVLGVDQSEEMLVEAYAKTMGSDNPPYFIHQRMERLRLPAPVDLVVCCLDGLNYLTDPEQVCETFRRVHEALTPNGLFIFDVNTPEKLRALDGQIFLDEDDEVFCLWRASFDEPTLTITYGMDVFQREQPSKAGGKRSNRWARTREEHVERAYPATVLCQWLTEAGFTNVRIYADRRLSPPEANEQRMFISAQKASETGASQAE